MRRQGLLICALLPLLAACGGWGADPLRIGITDWPGYEYFYLAQESGLARAQGLDLRVNQHSSLEDQRFSYERGDVDVLATTVSEALAICQEVPVRCPQLVLVLDESAGGDQLVARAGITGVEDLRGQAVGLERSVLAEYLLLRALEPRGLGLSDVRLSYGGPRALFDRLREGTVAALVTYPPHSQGLMGDPRFQVLFSSRQLPREVVDVLAVSPELVRRRPRQVGALVATWWAARRLATSQPHRATALMARRQGVSVAAFHQSEQLLRYVSPDQQSRWLAPGGWLEQGVAAMARRLQAVDRLDRTMPLPQVNSRWALPELRP